MIRKIAGVSGMVAAIAVLVAVCQPAAALQKRATKEKTAAAKEKAEVKDTETKKSTMRLPMYYTSVVNDDQREKIAAAFSKYNAKIAKLRAEIDEVTAERDAALAEMLTPAQRTKVAELKEEAKAKRAKTASK
jgi:hypothetical protein